jgi:hypothetical protein
LGEGGNEMTKMEQESRFGIGYSGVWRIWEFGRVGYTHEIETETFLDQFQDAVSVSKNPYRVLSIMWRWSLVVQCDGFRITPSSTNATCASQIHI